MKEEEKEEEEKEEEDEYNNGKRFEINFLCHLTHCDVSEAILKYVFLTETN